MKITVAHCITLSYELRKILRPFVRSDRVRSGPIRFDPHRTAPIRFCLFSQIFDLNFLFFFFFFHFGTWLDETHELIQQKNDDGRQCITFCITPWFLAFILLLYSLFCSYSFSFFALLLLSLRSFSPFSPDSSISTKWKNRARETLIGERFKKFDTTDFNFTNPWIIHALRRKKKTKKKETPATLRFFCARVHYNVRM